MTITLDASKRYDLNDLHSDMGHLAQLVETIADTVLNDCAFVAPGENGGNRAFSRQKGFVQPEMSLRSAPRHLQNTSALHSKRYRAAGSRSR